MTLTMEKLLDACRLVERIERETGGPIYPTPFNGVQVFEDHNCLADTTERTFPVSRHRSRRVHKKLVKRHGGEFKKEPAIFQIQGRIYAHPTRYAELRAAFKPR
jgi:hypothetical protein